MAKPNQQPVVSPPLHLSVRSQELWRSVVPRRASSPERLALLQAALEALDRADQARLVVNAEGMVMTTKRSGVSHTHPLLKTESENRKLFASIWGKLSFEFAPRIDGIIRE